MHSNRLNLLLLLPCELLASMQSCILSTTSKGVCQLLMLCKMIPTSSSCLISWSMNSQYFSSYCVPVLMQWVGPPQECQIWLSWSCQISIVFWEIIWGYFLFRSSWSFILASLGMSTSGMELAKGLVSGSRCKLVFCGILGSNLEVLHQSLFQLISRTSLHFPTGCIDMIGMFLLILHGMFLALKTGMLRYWGVLWLTLYKISNGMTPSGSWKVSAFNPYRLVVLGILEVLISMIHTDMGSRVTLPFVLIVG